MRFRVQNLASRASRVGCISDIERLPGISFETPLLLLYTKGGSIPHISYEVLQMITKEPQALQIPLPTIIHTFEAVSAYKKGIASFVGLKDYFVYCSVQDPAMATPQGYNDKDLVAIWARNGKQLVDADKYMDIMEAFLPDMFQPLCDGDTNVNSSKKRVTKSLERSGKLFGKCIQRYKKSEHLKESAMLGVVEGGYDLAARADAAKVMASLNMAGFVIDGLHNNGPDVEVLPYDRIKPVIVETIKNLPQEKFRIVHGCFDPNTVLSLIEDGVDVFDSSYPYLVTERGSALIFQFDEHDHCVPRPTETGSTNPHSEDQNNVNDLLRLNTQGMQQERTNQVRTGIPDAKYEMCLKDNVYAEDFRPVSYACSCLTCRKHTRAYIHHLLNTKELLGSVLLAIHNFHHYLEFFKSIRRALKSDSLQSIRRFIDMKDKLEFQSV